MIVKANNQFRTFDLQNAQYINAKRNEGYVRCEGVASVSCASTAAFGFWSPKYALRNRPETPYSFNLLIDSVIAHPFARTQVFKSF